MDPQKDDHEQRLKDANSYSGWVAGLSLLITIVSLIAWVTALLYYFNIIGSQNDDQQHENAELLTIGATTIITVAGLVATYMAYCAYKSTRAY